MEVQQWLELSWRFVFIPIFSFILIFVTQGYCSRMYVLLLSFSHFGNGCAKERIKCEAAAGNPKFFVEPSCQEKLVNYFFRQFCDGTLVCSKVTLNIFLGVQIAECVENTTHTWTLACQSKIKKSFLWLESKNGKHANFACLQFGPPASPRPRPRLCMKVKTEKETSQLFKLKVRASRGHRVASLFVFLTVPCEFANLCVAVRQK